jgi:hypothetical protein
MIGKPNFIVITDKIRRNFLALKIEVTGYDGLFYSKLSF